MSSSDPITARPPHKRQQSTSEPENYGNEAANGRARKKRIRNFTADDRAAHRVFEKSRREAFKERLTTLAGLLPALSDTDPQRLSKHVVVDECIKFLDDQKSNFDEAMQLLRAVISERDGLLAEVNQWRRRTGIEPRQPIAAEASLLPHWGARHLDPSASGPAEGGLDLEVNPNHASPVEEDVDALAGDLQHVSRNDAQANTGIPAAWPGLCEPNVLASFYEGHVLDEEQQQLGHLTVPDGPPITHHDAGSYPLPGAAATGAYGHDDLLLCLGQSEPFVSTNLDSGDFMDSAAPLRSYVPPYGQ